MMIGIGIGVGFVASQPTTADDPTLLIDDLGTGEVLIDDLGTGEQLHDDLGGE